MYQSSRTQVALCKMEDKWSKQKIKEKAKEHREKTIGHKRVRATWYIRRTTFQFVFPLCFLVCSPLFFFSFSSYLFYLHDFLLPLEFSSQSTYVTSWLQVYNKCIIFISTTLKRSFCVGMTYISVSLFSSICELCQNFNIFCQNLYVSMFQ